MRSSAVALLVVIVGWSYFLAWSISFYPQIFLNFRRRSVVGLNFDFLLLNVIGFAAYSAYNLFMYFDDNVQKQYEQEHPHSPIPVLLNDVFFAVHALIACIFTAAQCFFYERGNQRISLTCLVISTSMIMIAFGGGFITGLDIINMLQYVTSLSYIKMFVTLLKYIPQAMQNFRRKSTSGWSIGNVLLDFSGGCLDILQMCLQCWNVSDWSAFYGNPVKFGLGLVSILFDILFMTQHYVLYRKTDHLLASEKVDRLTSGTSETEKLKGSKDDSSTDSERSNSKSSRR
ncbi:Cystinosin [Parelaphostrongylus tenuis]|nr:Cystinosin [Parelaphostrongylus tenuis]